MSFFRTGDRVRYLVTQDIGVVEREAGSRVTVRFPGKWRASVVLAQNLVHAKYDRTAGELTGGRE